jgi:hypothetical protein
MLKNTPTVLYNHNACASSHFPLTTHARREHKEIKERGYHFKIYKTTQNYNKVTKFEDLVQSAELRMYQMYMRPLGFALRKRPALLRASEIHPRGYARNMSTEAPRKTVRVSHVAVGCLVTCGTLYAVNSKMSFRETTSMFEAGFRIMNLVYTAGALSIDYGWVLYQQRGRRSLIDEAADELRSGNDEFERLLFSRERGADIDESDLERARQRVQRAAERMAALMADPTLSPFHAVHTRCAERLRRMCMANKGVYIKLGQHLAQLDYMLPPEYIISLTSLLDKNPVSSIKSVQRTIAEDFGQNPEDLWLSFDPVPIASASLAQVHVAVDKHGRRCAVKVQHEGLIDSAQADMKAITAVVDIVSGLFNNYSYNWLVREMNRNLPRELDFKEEAKNMARAGSMISNDRVAVPSVYRVSDRVISMSFEEGCYVTDRERIDAMGLKSAEIARAISEVFSEQT